MNRYKLPPPDENAIGHLPSFHPNNYPRMANMPVEAFRETDEPLPDPARIYPPGKDFFQTLIQQLLTID